MVVSLTTFLDAPKSASLAWVTQPPWVHQFRFGWTNAHPITKPGAITKVQSHFFLGPRPFQEIFFSPEDLACSPNYPVQKNIPTYPALLLLLRIFFSKLSFILLSLSMLQLCDHPLSLLMFKEKLGIVTTSRCEQHEVQYFQEETKQSLSSTIFFALVISLYFQFGFRFIKFFALTAYMVHQDLDKAWWSDRVWWNDCCWRTRLIIFARMQVHFFS